MGCLQVRLQCFLFLNATRYPKLPEAWLDYGRVLQRQGNASAEEVPPRSAAHSRSTRPAEFGEADGDAGKGTDEEARDFFPDVAMSMYTLFYCLGEGCSDKVPSCCTTMSVSAAGWFRARAT